MARRFLYLTIIKTTTMNELQLAQQWYHEAGIKSIIEGTDLYISIEHQHILVHPSEVAWRAECQAAGEKTK